MRVASDSTTGHTLNDYIALVKKRWETANIVVDGDVGSIKLPNVDLPRVTLPLALEWVARTSAAREKGVVLQTVRSAGQAGEVFVFTPAATPVTRAAPEQVFTKTYYVEQSIEGRPNVTAEVVRTAIEDVLKKQTPPAQGTAKYNPATRVITVAGSRGDIQAADQAVETMTRGQRVAAVLERLQTEVERQKTSIEQLKATIEQLKGTRELTTRP